MSTGIQPPPSTLAREAFRQLSVRRISPTPENYARVYAETAQLKLGEVIPAVHALESFARELRTESRRGSHLQQLGHDLARAIEKADWEGARASLKAVLISATPPPASIGVAVASEGAGAPPGRRAENDLLVELRDLASRNLTFLVDTRLGYSEDAVASIQTIAAAILGADTPERVREIGSKLKQLWVRCELRNEGPEPLLRALHGLTVLLLRNVGDLSADDKWLTARVEAAKELLAGPLTPKALAATERNFKESAYRQSAIRASVEEAKAGIRDMMAAFIERLSETTEATGGYSARLSGYADAIRGATDLRDLSGVLETLIADTNLIKSGISRSHNELESARREVEVYEKRIATLEAKLAESEHLTREDPVTRLLNRRGLEEQFLVEETRAKRTGRTIQIALVQINDFRLVGDLLGAAAADAALQHFAGILAGTTRPTDTVGRFGNEAFLAIFPEAQGNTIEKTFARATTELARKPLVWNDAEVALTFSVGIAERRIGDGFDDLVQRADVARGQTRGAAAGDTTATAPT